MKNGTQVKPVHIDKLVDKIVDVSVNPYQEALTQEVDSHLHEESSLEMKRCDLTWSILSTEIDYTNDKDNSPYSVVLLHCGCLSLIPFIEISIRNNSSSSDVLNIQASISISPKFESK